MGRSSAYVRGNNIAPRVPWTLRFPSDSGILISTGVVAVLTCQSYLAIGTPIVHRTGIDVAHSGTVVVALLSCLVVTGDLTLASIRIAAE